MERLEFLNKFLETELPEFVKTYYDEYSLLYPNRYQSIGIIESNEFGKISLFKFLENWFEREYEIPFRINNHFQFHTNNIFFSPTKNFGFESEIRKYEDFYMLDSDYRKIPNESSSYNIFTNLFSQKPISSKIIREKIKTDLELESLYWQFNLKSYFKRFFLQGGVDSSWITIDKLYHYGVDYFPNILEKELESIEYSSEFYFKYSHLGVMYDEYGIMVENQEEIIKNDINYFKELKKKGYSNLDYNDILAQPSFLNLPKESDSTYLYSNSKAVGKFPILKLNYHFTKRVKSLEYKNKLQKLREKSKSYYNNFEYKPPFEITKRFKLDPSDFIKDEFLLSQYLESYNEPENKIRELFNLPKIGEGWISETFLFYQLKNHFSNDFLIHHGKPKWLGKQHLDIYFPKYNLGIEYQGDQHYYPIDFFGGEKSFTHNKERDLRKKILCKDNNCILIEVKPNYKIENLIDQISEIINSKKSY